MQKIHGSRQIMPESLDNNLFQDGVLSHLKITNGENIMFSDSPVISANLDAGGYKIYNLAAPTSDSDAASKAYVDNVATQSKIWKELVLHPSQFLSDTTNKIGQVLSAQMLWSYNGANLSSGNTIHLTKYDQISDYNSPVVHETYVAGTDFAIGATYYDTLVNLQNAINAGSEFDAYVVPSTSVYIGYGTQTSYLVVISTSVEYMSSIYGTGTALRVLPTSYSIEGKASSSHIGDLSIVWNAYEALSGDSCPTTAPSAPNFGFSVSASYMNETRYARVDDATYTFNKDAGVWNQTASSSVPLASTSVYGKVKVLANQGLSIANGDLSVNYDNSTIGVTAGGSLQIKDAGVTAAKVGFTQDAVGDGATYKQYNPAAVAITGGTITGATITAPSVVVDSITIDNSTIVSSTTLDVSSTSTLTLAGTSVVLNGAISGSAIVDEDTMVSDSSTKVPTQQSVKAYVDAKYTDAVNSATTLASNKLFLGNDSGVAAEATIVFNEVPSETPDGIITDFTVSSAPRNGFLMVFVNGILQGSSDYSLSGATVSFIEPPESVDSIAFSYISLS